MYIYLASNTKSLYVSVNWPSLHYRVASAWCNLSNQQIVSGLLIIGIASEILTQLVHS